MSLRKEDLSIQMLEYRKASRALMWYWDSSQKLYELICENLKLMDLSVRDVDLEDQLTDWDRPKGVTLDAFTAITVNRNDWSVECCTANDFKMKKDSFYLRIFLNLDIWPKNSPDKSLSVLEIYGWYVKSLKGKAIDSYVDSDDSYDHKLIDENSGIDKDGELLKPMVLKIFPDLWSSGNGKYKGDYAAGLYDLSELVDEDAVLDTVITDIRGLVAKWS
jgi:hypothetical protein